MIDDAISVQPNEALREERPARTPDRGLVYRREMVLHALRERVDVVKTPHAMVAFGDDGLPRSIRELLAADQRAWRDTFGAVSPDLRDLVESVRATEQVPISIVYSAPDLLVLRRAVHEARTSREQRDAEARVSLYLAHQRRRVLRLLRSVNAVTVAESQHAPLLGASVPAGALSQLASLEEVRVIQHAPGGSGVPAADPVDPIDFHHVSTFYGANGFYAAGQRIGLLDVFLEEDGVRCGIWEEHEAFSHSPPVKYGPTMPPTTCSSDSDCTSVFCNLCRGGQCVLQHSTEVMSVIAASSMTEPRGAAEAEMFIPTVDVCEFAPVMFAFDWFRNEQVYTAVNVVGACGDPALGDMIDAYARSADMVITDVSGNDGERVAHIACSSVNSVCVGGVDSTSAMYCKSAWRNLSDREEPDVVALAGQDSDCAEADEGVRVADAESGDPAPSWKSRPLDGVE